MRKVVTLMTMLFILLLFIPSISQAKSHKIESVDIHAFIFPDGDLFVEELHTYTLDGYFSGPTRYIADDLYDNIDFFEAYLAPPGAELGYLSRYDVQPLSTEAIQDGFRVYESTDDEVATFLYRYNLQGAIEKHLDIAELNWRFFDDQTEDDIRNLQIHIELLGHEELSEGSYGFVHDMNKGEFEILDSSFSYTNEFLPKGEKVEVRFLFPEDFLSEVDLTTGENKLTEILKEEQVYNDRIALREKWLPILEMGTARLVILFSFVLMAVIFYLPRILRIFRRAATINEIEQVDSFTLATMFRKQDFKYRDINSSLFRMLQENILTVEYSEPSGESHHQTIGWSQYTFIVRDESSPLDESERYLIHWLFSRDEKGRLSLTTDTFKKMERKKENVSVKEMRHKRKQLNNKYKKWKKLAQQHEEAHQWYKVGWFRRIFAQLIIPFWFLWVNVYNWTVNVEAGLLMRVLTTVGSIALLAFFLYRKRGRVLATLMFALSLAFLPDLGFDDQMENLFHITVSFMFISALLPEKYPTLNGIPYFKGVHRWRKQMIKGTLPFPDSKEGVQRYMEHAIALEVDWYFWKNYKKQLLKVASEEDVPFITARYNALFLDQAISPSYLNQY